MIFFVTYHLKIATEEIEDEYIFYLIQENINNLRIRDASNTAAQELINLIEEGYTIDPFNMSKLIETLTYKDASNNATAVLLKAIEKGIKFGPKERLLLAEMSKIANARKNVEKIRKALHERENKP